LIVIYKEFVAQMPSVITESYVEEAALKLEDE